MCNLLVQRRQTRPLGSKAKKLDDMDDDDDDWEECDALIVSTIKVHLTYIVCFFILDTN